MSKKKKFRLRGFWLGYTIYVGVLVVLLFIFGAYIWNQMIKYQDAEPENVIEDIVDDMSDKDPLDVFDFGSLKIAKFENKEVIADQIRARIKGQELTFKKAEDSYDALAPVFDVYAGKDCVAKITLQQEEEHKIMFILTLSDWKVASITPVVEAGSITKKITVPSDFKVTVNSIPLTKDDMDAEPKVSDEFKYASEYVDAPLEATYTLTGFLKEPTIAINDNNGNAVDLSGFKDEIKLSYSPVEMPGELKDYVLNVAKNYSNFFSRDLEGCSTSTACISGYFPEGSYYLEMAEKYRQEDMWMYSAHDKPVFNNQSVTEYKKYNDNLFSCHIYFDKSMYLAKTGATKVDTVNSIYYFVNIGGKWVIADIQTVIK